MASLPVTLSTPVKSKSLLQSVYSTHAPSRDSAVTALGKLMAPRVVGPMPAQEFLSTYLPSETRPATISDARRFALVSRTKPEDKAYFPFITAATALVPGLSFVDTHARGEQDSGFSFEIKPDITVYSDDRKEKVGSCETKSMEMHIEFKWQDQSDPFIVPSDKTPRGEQRFVKESATAGEMLGQITAYAAAQMSAQFRTHIFSIFVMRQTARILRWDREGVVVTEPIPYGNHPALVEFLFRYSQASPEERGVDTTISRAAEHEAKLAREKLMLPPETQMFKTKVPKAEPADEQPTPQAPKSVISLIFPASRLPSELPACRATRGSPAYCVEEDCTVYLKDSWRIVAEGIVPEGDIYAELNKKGVQHVPVCLASGEVEGHILQRPQTWTCSQKDWACCFGLHVSVHSHYRLVLNIVGKALSEFASSRELVQAIRDALEAHRAAHVIQILHRDVSAGNIVIFMGSGFLIDWEMGKFLNSVAPRRTSRTGTWQFMSAHLVEDRTAEQSAADDMESAFWVLLWTALMYSPSSVSDERRSRFIKNTFESDEGSEGKRSVFAAQTIFDPPLFPNREALNKLLKELADLFKYFYDTVEESDKMILAEPSSSHLLLSTHPAYKRFQARKRLMNHEYIIQAFDRHLDLDWPTDDAAEERKFLDVDLHRTRQVIMRKSKHTLEVINEERGSKRPKVVIRKAVSDTILGGHSL